MLLSEQNSGSYGISIEFMQYTHYALPIYDALEFNFKSLAPAWHEKRSVNKHNLTNECQNFRGTIIIVMNIYEILPTTLCEHGDVGSLEFLAFQSFGF